MIEAKFTIGRGSDIRRIAGPVIIEPLEVGDVVEISKRRHVVVGVSSVGVTSLDGGGVVGSRDINLVPLRETGVAIT